jgi:acetate kinase
MATRSGSVDPGLLLWLQEHEHLSGRQLTLALEKHSGLLGLAGTSDMREVEAAAGRDDPNASLALDVYTHRLVAGIAAMSAAIGGLDALVFTGGVGERSATIRRRAAERLGYLGVEIDEASNLTAQGEQDISGPHASVNTLIIPAREDIEIARETRRILNTDRAVPAGAAT